MIYLIHRQELSVSLGKFIPFSLIFLSAPNWGILVPQPWN